MNKCAGQVLYEVINRGYETDWFGMDDDDKTYWQVTAELFLAQIDHQ